MPSNNLPKARGLTKTDIIGIASSNQLQELILSYDADTYMGSVGHFGWKDLQAPFVIKAIGGTGNPTWATITGNIQGLSFSATAMNQVWVDFHIDHDYALGTVIYPHIHYMPYTASSGTVRWGIEYVVVKGHHQASGSVMGATVTKYINQAIPINSAFKHFIAEVSDADAIPATLLEPDSVIKCRIFRDATSALDTFPDPVHAWQADCHYNAGRIATKNKAPNFYA